MDSPWDFVAMSTDEKKSRRYAYLFKVPRLPKPRAKLGSARPQSKRKFEFTIP
jgi:hypothetical protein